MMIMKQGKTNQLDDVSLRKKTFQTFWSQKYGMISNYSSQELDPRTPITYRSHYDTTIKAFTTLVFHSKAKTHAARGSRSRMAELAGATESQIRILGVEFISHGRLLLKTQFSYVMYFLHTSCGSILYFNPVRSSILI
ncbi:hypothetical protein PHPALM_27770 [Phytophthora palmivora]|uniref:Uncharacterized protein n=1 Tax=Phytophthora palmivora TaxID=4796 RepID=A0A2P4XBS1_9STRA|nr:hypothetical protein PHPALM_27770 [Phytophthora palmivora]